MATDLNVCAHETILSATPEVELAALKNIGAQGVRIGAVWQYVEPNKGQFTGYPVNTNALPQGFEAVDLAVIAARNLGLNVNLLLNTPRPGWAGTGSSADWGNFCKQAALRYKNIGVKQFEIGNEWNIGANWDPGSWWFAGGYVLSEIAAYIKAASVAIKSVIPDAVIVSCGMAACIDWPNRWGSRGPAQRLPSSMVSDLAGAGVLPYVDKIGYHPYTLADDLGTWQSPTVNHKFIQEVLAIHTVLVNVGHGSKKIELTEYGWSTTDYSEATVGDYIKTEWDILHTPSFAPYIDGHFIYCGKDFVYPGQTYSASSREMNFGALHQDVTPKTGITSKISALS